MENKAQLKALAAFRSQLGLSEGQEQSIGWSRVVERETVDEALLKLFKDKTFMKPIRREVPSAPVTRDVYVRLRNICDRLDPG